MSDSATPRLDPLARPAFPLTQRVVRGLLERGGFRPSRRRGQCFLVDGNMLRFLVRAFEPSSEEAVLEVGTGLGNLTGLLLEEGAVVLSVERDRRLLEIARAILPRTDRLRLHSADLLERGQLRDEVLRAWIDLARHHGLSNFAVCANFPYAIASHAIVSLLARAPRPLRVIVGMVQAEVADRIVASPGSREFGSLTVATALLAKPEIVRRISPSLFWPRPEVHSAILRIRPHPRAGSDPPSLARVERVLKTLFPLRRRTLASALRTVLRGAPGDPTALLASAGLEPDRRVGTLTVEDWEGLLRAWGEHGRLEDEET